MTLQAEKKTPEITTELVQDLIAQQFLKWADLTIRPVKKSGWDNRTFHLGNEMLVRLPSAERYAAKVKIEQEWLPKLKPHLPYPIPQPIAMGQPSDRYPWHWSVYRWIEGENADTLEKADLPNFAKDCAKFLNALYKIDTIGGPLAGPHNFYRGTDPVIYDSETRHAISALDNVIDQNLATAVWEKALQSKWNVDPVWIHGDFSVGNILVRDGKLTAVIDFGGMAIGDPACDLVIAWTYFDSESRKIFKSGINLDANTWARARGWCLWKALITLVKINDTKSKDAEAQIRVIKKVLSD